MIVRKLLLPSLLFGCSAGFDDTDKGSGLDNNINTEPSEELDPDDVDDDNDGFTENQGDCDDNNNTIYPNAPEVADDGIDQDCNGTDLVSDSELSLSDVRVGDLIITEIMKNPSAVDDSQGEWFEIYNSSNFDINLKGLMVSDASEESFTVSGDQIVGSQQYFVLGNNSNSSSNGGASVDYQFSNWSLGNDSDEIILSYDNDALDYVAYTSSFPDGEGTSLNLNPSQISTSANDNASKWCESTSYMSGGDQGTPGAANDACSGSSNDGDNTDDDGDGYTENQGDCNDADSFINPGALDIGQDGIDQDCSNGDEEGLCDDTCQYAGDGECDDGGTSSDYDICALGTDCTDCSARDDNDYDGYYDVQDCDDFDYYVNPGVQEDPSNGYDDDCDGEIDESPGTDADGDGFESIATGGEDCDDNDASVYPGAEEIADDLIDQDCQWGDLESLCNENCSYSSDGDCDDGGYGADYDNCDLGSDCDDCGPRYDEDGDGYDSRLDCDDNDQYVYPGVDCDICDGVDEDGDGTTDEDGDQDPNEPFSVSSPVSLGGALIDLGDTASNTGYIFPSTDDDAFFFFFEDKFLSTADAFNCSIESPFSVSVDLYFEQDGTTGYSLIDSYSGSSVSIDVTDTYFYEDGGYYMLKVSSTSGSSCSDPYTITCTKSDE
ncbi:MAG: MopE-related protein [Myxococcota bacterium]|nr:MopE-related protein [Myxococcota bacterium]